MAMKNNNRLLYFLALIKFILPFLLQNSIYQPHRDEFLYLAEGHHMAWGFMEVPPMLSVFAWLTHILGDGFFWVKFWPSLFGALTFLVTGKIIISLGGRSFALLLGFLPFVFGVYLRIHFLFQPNFLEIFFWTLIAYALIRFIQSGQTKWLYYFGICCGLGMQSKYSVAFFIASVLFGLVLTNQRKIFTRKHLYLAALVGFILFLPNLIWQYTQHFPVVFHMKKLQETQLQYVSPSSFLVDQVIMNFPCVFIWMAGLWSAFFVKRLKPYRFIGWAYLGVIGLLLLAHGKNYYALGAYPVLFALGACQLEQLTALRFKPARYAMVIFPILLGYWLIPVALPILPPQQLADFYVKRHVQKLGALKWEDGKNHPLPQDFADMLGWEEMAQKMAKAYNTLDSNEKKNTLLFCDNYGQAGAVNYYRNKYQLPEALSDNASFLYWIPDSLHFDNILLLTDDEKEMEHSFIKNFSSVVLSDSITSAYARERGDLIILLKGMNETMRQLFKEKINKDKEALKRWKHNNQ
jgi:Dolichyl-phosphate-mannose-protein mannosyltransferase